MITYMDKKNIGFFPYFIAFMLVLHLNISNSNKILNLNNPDAINNITLSHRTLHSDCSFGNKKEVKNISVETVNAEITNLTLHLPEYFKYKTVNEDALKAYLNTRSSILKEDPYFTSIVNVGRNFNINPILLFAITGQEQGFVPEEQVSASLIANNPYNVFCSWQSYNTDIIDSSEIACRTIINLSKDRPDSVDPLVWVNRKYSSDQNWHSGVRSLYNEINNFIDDYEKKSTPN